MAMRGLFLLSCFGFLPLAIVIALIVFIVLWLREKTARDEMVLNLLGEIGDTLAETRKKMNEER